MGRKRGGGGEMRGKVERNARGKGKKREKRRSKDIKFVPSHLSEGQTDRQTVLTVLVADSAYDSSILVTFASSNSLHWEENGWERKMRGRWGKGEEG
jgi:hypothetical protein